MLTNMENQLREQGATDRLDEVLEEIPRVREDLGFLPLVTPTSQIVGTQAVLNVLTGERYKTIAKETAGVLRGEYGATPAPVSAELQDRVLEDGESPVTCRPADLIDAEMDDLTGTLKQLAEEKGIKLARDMVDDVLIYAQFPQVGLKFLENRGNPAAFEPAPGETPVAQAAPAATAAAAGGVESYHVTVDGRGYDVTVGPGGAVSSVQPAAAATVGAASPAPGGGQPVPAPLAGSIHKVNVKPGDRVNAGDVIMILEAMKMETEVRSPAGGTVTAVNVREGDVVQVGDALLTLS
jgi:oxaloacetate decarboxylase alpha subunit